jgi:hypothetical protein
MAPGACAKRSTSGSPGHGPQELALESVKDSGSKPALRRGGEDFAEQGHARQDRTA